MREHENLVIIGFDFGHGEFSLAKLFMSGGDSEIPEIIEINKRRKSQVTAIGYSNQGKLLIGDKAMKYDSDGIEINFKANPLSPKFKQETIQNFCKGLIECMKEEGKIELDKENYLFVGCPSGWTQDSKNKYEKLIASSISIPQVKVFVIPESRAAFMHAQKIGQFASGDLKKGVLVIDIGSSTTDFTFVVNGQDNPIDEGEDIGGVLIDRAIFDYTLHRHPERHKLETIFKKSISLKSRAEFSCRKSKEKFFDNLDDFSAQPDVLVNEIENIQGILFTPQVSSKIMQAILNEARLPELENKSWSGAYHDTLQRVKDKIGSQGYSPSKILLTGGAARMSFTLEICKKVFSESKLISGDEPEFIVSRGLARYGRIFILTTDFSSEAFKVINEQLRKLIESKIKNLTDSLAESLSDKATTDVIPSELKKWNERKFQSSQALEESINKKIQTWLNSDEADTATISSVNIYCKEVQKEIDKFLDPICTKYNLPKGVLGTSTFKFTKKIQASSNFSRKALEYTYRATDFTNTGWGAGLGAGLGASAGAGAGAGAAWLLGVAATGPIGWTALGVGAVGAVIGAALATTEETRTATRRYVDNQTLQSLLNQEKAKLKQSIQSSYDINREQIRSDLVDKIFSILDNSLKEKINRARLLIP